MSEQDLSDPEAPVLRVPACDSCRSRKIKCDRKAPCSSCKSSHVVCRTTKRNPEKKQRILVSGRYEREIGDVNARLASLEKILQTIVNHNQVAGADPPRRALSESLSTPHDSQQVERELGFEGESSFSAHSKWMAQSFESSLNNVPSSRSGQDVSAAVATLRDFFGRSSGRAEEAIQVQTPLHEIIHYPQLSHLALPPMDAVLRLLRYIKIRGHRFFYECPILSLQEVTELCQNLYFPAEPYTIATFITIHVALYHLFADLPPAGLAELNMTKSDTKAILDTCAKNGEAAARNMRLFMDPTYENIQALMMGSLLAMETSRPAFGWTLVATACRLCQEAGYHRLPPYSVAPQPEMTRKRLCFWFIYSSDRVFALNSGRSPNIQDYDITVERPKVPEEIEGTWGEMYCLWIEYSVIQGDIYEQLYCARAQKAQIKDKIPRARALADRLHELQRGFEAHASRTPDVTLFRDALLSSQIVMLSTLTLVYRIIPPTASSNNQAHHPLKPCDEALSTARDALIANNAAWDILQHGDEWRSFVHWTLLWCPFVPFLVVFSNVIVERSREDLELLDKVVATLKSAAPKSTSIEKLERACRIFCKIASIYLDQTEASMQQQPVPLPTSTAMPVPSISAQRPTTASSSSMLQADVQSIDTILPDLPLSQQAWDGMFDEWDLGLGAENAREMSSYFEHLTGAGAGFTMLANGHQGPFG